VEGNPPIQVDLRFIGTWGPYMDTGQGKGNEENPRVM